jgi:hypothetical protein
MADSFPQDPVNSQPQLESREPALWRGQRTPYGHGELAWLRAHLHAFTVGAIRGDAFARALRVAE